MRLLLILAASLLTAPTAFAQAAALAPAPTVTLTLDQLDRLVHAENDAYEAGAAADRAARSGKSAADVIEVIKRSFASELPKPPSTTQN